MGSLQHLRVLQKCLFIQFLQQDYVAISSSSVKEESIAAPRAFSFEPPGLSDAMVLYLTLALKLSAD